MNIRPAHPEDLVDITAIYGRSVEEEFASFELYPPTVEDMTSRYHAIVEGGYPYLVALVDGKVAGYCYASAYRPRPAYASTVENTVYVNPDYWRRGVATGLLTELISACRASGFRQMIAIASCRPDAEPHQISSVRFHASLGFELKGRLHRVGNKHDLWLDVILMQLSLE